jgi:hypothetical protein
MKSKIYNPYKRWFFASLLLLFVSLSAFSGLLWKQYRMQNANKAITAEQESGRFRKHMRFSDHQETTYNSLLDEYHAHTSEYRKALFEMQEHLMNELAKEQVDTVRLAEISLQAAQMQHLIRLETFHHLLEIKAISSPEQQEALQYLYNDLINESRVRNRMQNGKAGEGRGRQRQGR